ncbi:MAG: hypothetical protein M3Q81_04535 [bacterium]|nr:hypothetical protein [bacterium]
MIEPAYDILLNTSDSEKDRFREYSHTIQDRQRMSFDKIVDLANEWKRDNGGGYRRSDRKSLTESQKLGCHLTVVALLRIWYTDHMGTYSR